MVPKVFLYIIMINDRGLRDLKFMSISVWISENQITSNLCTQFWFSKIILSDVKTTAAQSGSGIQQYSVRHIKR